MRASTCWRRSRSWPRPPTWPPSRRVLQRAHDAGVTVAVNHNGRWAPAWRLATLLVRDGAIGDVVGVTHVHDKPLPPLAGTPFDEVDHMLVTDYLLHWIDISRTWLAPADVTTVQAGGLPRARAGPGPPGTRGRRPCTWRTSVGSSASLRIVGDVVVLETRVPVLDPRHRGHPARQRADGLRRPRPGP